MHHHQCRVSNKRWFIFRCRLFSAWTFFKMNKALITDWQNSFFGLFSKRAHYLRCIGCKLVIDPVWTYVISVGVYCRSSPPSLALQCLRSCKWILSPLTDQDIYVKSWFSWLMFLYDVVLNIFQCWQSLFDIFSFIFPFWIVLMM